MFIDLHDLNVLLIKMEGKAHLWGDISGLNGTWQDFNELSSYSFWLERKETKWRIWHIINPSSSYSFLVAALNIDAFSVTFYFCLELPWEKESKWRFKQIRCCVMFVQSRWIAIWKKLKRVFIRVQVEKNYPWWSLEDKESDFIYCFGNI